MKYRVIACTIILLILTQEAPVLAQTSYGQPGNGVTWQQIQDKSWQVGTPQTVAATVASAISSIQSDNHTYLVNSSYDVTEDMGTLALKTEVQTSIQKAAGDVIAENAGEAAAGSEVSEIGVDAVEAGSGVADALTGVGLVVTALQITWPADLNWEQAGTPLICVNADVSAYPHCYAYYVPNNAAMLSWTPFNPKSASQLSAITSYLLKVSVGLENVVNTNPTADECWLGGPVSVSQTPANLKQVNLTSSQTYNVSDLNVGENKFFMMCHTPAASWITQAIDTVLNTLSVVAGTLWDGIKAGFTSMLGTVFGIPGIIGVNVINSNQSFATEYPTLYAYIHGTYQPPFPIPQDVVNTNSVIVAVNPPTPPPPQPPTVTFSASPSLVTPTQSSLLTWSSTNAQYCVGSSSPGDGGWESAVSNASGQYWVTPSQTTTYTIDCIGNGGDTQRSQVVTVANPGTPQVEIMVQ
ncbi:hypothetical protein M1295_01580 [Patescibacteria group bacterium]|nr:hypothetical protein [Patescibacteria group bacterium]